MRSILHYSVLTFLIVLMICGTGFGARYINGSTSTTTSVDTALLGIKGEITIIPSGNPVTLQNEQHTTIHSGDTATGSNPLTIQSNAPWTLTAKSTTDKMMSGSNSLASYMQAAIGTTPTTWYDISTTLPTVNLDSGPMTGTSAVTRQANYRQLFGSNDVGGVYSITVTWTATATYT